MRSIAASRSRTGSTRALPSATPERTGGSGENQARRIVSRYSVVGGRESSRHYRLPTPDWVSMWAWAWEIVHKPADTHAGLALHPDHDRARRGVRVDLGRPVERAWSPQADAGEAR